MFNQIKFLPISVSVFTKLTFVHFLLKSIKTACVVPLFIPAGWI